MYESLGNDHVVIAKLNSMACIFYADHLLMKLLSVSNAYNGVRKIWPHGSCQICDFHAWDFRNKNFPSAHFLKCVDYKINRLLKRYPKPCNTRICDWKRLG